MNAKKKSAYYKVEIESKISDMDIILKKEYQDDILTPELEIIIFEETDKRENLLSVLLADIKWTINSDGKVSYINPYLEDCIGNDATYIIKKIVSRFLTPSSVMACLIELEELMDILRTSKNTRQRKLIVDVLENDSGIEKIEISSAAIFDTLGNVVGIRGLCKYLIK